MTAQDLHTLVSKWPEVWGPLGFLNGTWTYKSWGNHAPIDPLHAADLIAGELRRRLTAYIVNGDKDGKFGIASHGHIRAGFATELEALLAAYGAGKEAGK